MLLVVLSQGIEDIEYSPRVLQKFEVGRVPIYSRDILNPAVQGGPPMFGILKQSRKIEQEAYLCRCTQFASIFYRIDGTAKQIGYKDTSVEIPSQDRNVQREGSTDLGQGASAIVPIVHR